MVVRRRLSAVFLFLSVTVAATTTETDDGADGAVRTNPPFTGPATLPDGSFGFQLSVSDASNTESMVVAEVPRGALLSASEVRGSTYNRPLAVIA
jgi:hypothetical protein